MHFGKHTYNTMKYNVGAIGQSSMNYPTNSLFLFTLHFSLMSSFPSIDSPSTATNSQRANQ